MDNCVFYMQRPGGDKIKIKRKPVTICDWRERKITTSTMTLELNLREVQDLQTDAYLHTQCEVMDTTLKSLKLDCEKETVDSTYHGQIFRSWFDWDEWHGLTRQFKSVLTSLVFLANFGGLALDSTGSANKFWMSFFDLLDAHNFIQLWHKVGLEYGFTSEQTEWHSFNSPAHLLRHSGHDERGTREYQKKWDRKYKLLSLMVSWYGFYMFIPQFFIDLDAMISSTFDNFGVTATYTTYANPYYLGLASMTSSTSFATDWKFYY